MSASEGMDVNVSAAVACGSGGLPGSHATAVDFERTYQRMRRAVDACAELGVMPISIYTYAGPVKILLMEKDLERIVVGRNWSVIVKRDEHGSTFYSCFEMGLCWTANCGVQ